jgi:hypothetical protein
MAGDDCSLHFNLDELTAKQREDHVSNQVLTAMLQVALLYIAKSEDEVCLYDTFTQAPWRDALLNYHELFAAMGLQPTPLDQVQYHPVNDFYASVAARASNCETETLYMVSGSNYPLHENDALLTVSQNLNSKVHFAEHAPAFGLPVPDTLHCRKAELESDRVKAFFAQQKPPLMLKTLGLAGARNVTTIDSLAAAADYMAEYDVDMDVILQQRLRTEDYTEMTVDLFVSNADIHVTNVRQIMFADGLWVGNLMGNAVRLPAAHEQALLRVGAYARSHGYQSALGFNLGIDYFIRNPQADQTLPELVITEINARWTGGLFPAELMRRLDVQDQPVVAFIDMCPPQHFDSYQHFLERHLYRENSADAFSIAPMGFAPFSSDVDGTDYLFVWQIVIGNFDAFKQAKAAELDETVLVTAPKISTDL